MTRRTVILDEDRQQRAHTQLHPQNHDAVAIRYCRMSGRQRRPGELIPAAEIRAMRRANYEAMLGVYFRAVPSQPQPEN